MIQLNVLYGHPTDPAAFEAYYAGTHMPLAGRVLGPHVKAIYTTRCMPDQNGAKPAYYRVATLLFDSMDKVQQALGMPDGRAVVADLDNFATGGYTFLMGEVEGQAESGAGEPAAAASA
jgi:uncharacterized protein (TIGR02118 family)